MWLERSRPRALVPVLAVRMVIADECCGVGMVGAVVMVWPRTVAAPRVRGPPVVAVVGLGVSGAATASQRCFPCRKLAARDRGSCTFLAADARFSKHSRLLAFASAAGLTYCPARPRRQLDRCTSHPGPRIVRVPGAQYYPDIAGKLVQRRNRHTYRNVRRWFNYGRC